MEVVLRTESLQGLWSKTSDTINWTKLMDQLYNGLYPGNCELACRQQCCLHLENLRKETKGPIIRSSSNHGQNKNEDIMNRNFLKP
jgi:hypothetical protein